MKALIRFINKYILGIKDPFPMNGTGIIIPLDHDPTSSEPLGVGVVELYNFATNINTNTLFICVDATPNALKWNKISSLPFNY